METQTTEQLKCNKEQEKKDGSSPSMFARFRQYVIQAIKDVLRYYLLKPSTWRFLLVHVPDLVDKALQSVKDFFAYFTDLF